MKRPIIVKINRWTFPCWITKDITKDIEELLCNSYLTKNELYHESDTYCGCPKDCTPIKLNIRVEIP